MPLGRGIVEVFEAIPDRIEVSGHDPTWRVTGGSFESALYYAREAFGEAVVVAREDRRRWWPRVTLTLTQDPALVPHAPPVEAFADPEPVEPASRPVEAFGDPQPVEPDPQPVEPDPQPVEPVEPSFESALDEIFAHQEELRLARRRIPEQRTRGGG